MWTNLGRWSILNQRLAISYVRVLVASPPSCHVASISCNVILLLFSEIESGKGQGILKYFNPLHSSNFEFSSNLSVLQMCIHSSL